ncbi:MAG: hypothetical protein H3C43_06820 [Leptonema sp. (in: Bacteria)]|nr:hypothetical protein [Leptonema sp. (in: bacteria)]
MMNRYYLHFAIAAILFLFSSCDQQRAAIDDAKELVEAGDFELALDHISRIDSSHTTPAIEAMRGAILSLEPATMIDGMFLMNRSVDLIDDAPLRYHLFLFYLDASLLYKAKELVSGERIGPERFFRKDMLRLRSAVKCFEYPNSDAALKMVEELNVADESTDKMSEKMYRYTQNGARFLALRCLADGIRSLSKSDNLYWLLDENQRQATIQTLPNRVLVERLVSAFVELVSVDKANRVDFRNRCDMLFRLGPKDVIESSTGEISIQLQTEMRECKKEFPGSFTIRRVWPISLDGIDDEQGASLLFNEKPFYPDYEPRPEYEPIVIDEPQGH